jgi:hypothetical protein
METKSKATSSRSRLGRAASSVSDAISRVTRRTRSKGDEETPVAAAVSEPKRSAAPAKTAARTTRRESDIPLDVLDRTYTPADTSTKAGFRSDGSDHARDQEFAGGVADERWNDEDHYTNKSNDPRIGTHGRSYQPGESRADSRDR